MEGHEGPYQWPYKWITVFVFTPISGVITLLITGISIGAHFVTNSSNHSASSESPEDIFFCFLALGDKQIPSWMSLQQLEEFTKASFPES